MTGGYTVQDSQDSRLGNKLQEAGAVQAGRTGAGRRFKSRWEARQLTPTGTRQDFLLHISSLQAEGKVLATDPCMDAWALLGASWPRTLLLASQPPSPPLATSLGPMRSHETHSSTDANNFPPQVPASPAGFIQRLWGFWWLGSRAAPESGLSASTFPAAEGTCRPLTHCGTSC